MTIQEAIEILEERMYWASGAGDKRWDDTLKLGTEALKWIKWYRSNITGAICRDLPGETKE